MTESIETLEASAQNRAFAQSDRAYALGLPGKVRNAHIVSAVIRRGQPRLRNTAARISRPITLGPIGPDCVTDRRQVDASGSGFAVTLSVHQADQWNRLHHPALSLLAVSRPPHGPGEPEVALA
jgi:hypothetical protein